MRKPIIGAVVAIAAIAAVRRFGPDLKERAKAKCHAMMSAPAAAPCCAAAAA
ncbi:MAG TPA: hypothetical protein VFV20_06450 [Candidatus Limnocylindria bacterium]|nr:hypothetical protein [Candidatus Limnocylindria bacterium]